MITSLPFFLPRLLTTRDITELPPSSPDLFSISPLTSYSPLSITLPLKIGFRDPRLSASSESKISTSPSKLFGRWEGRDTDIKTSSSPSNNRNSQFRTPSDFLIKVKFSTEKECRTDEEKIQNLNFGNAYHHYKQNSSVILIMTCHNQTFYVDLISIKLILKNNKELVEGFGRYICIFQMNHQKHNQLSIESGTLVLVSSYFFYLKFVVLHARFQDQRHLIILIYVISSLFSAFGI